MTKQITKSIIVHRDASKVYALWSAFENFPHFMKHIKSVQKMGDGRHSRWVMEGPLGSTITWEVETTSLEENKRIAWNSKDKDGDIKTSGQVTFTALPQEQTEVTVTLQYVAPAGPVGEVVAGIFGSPEYKLQEDLLNFKAYAEGRFEHSELPVQKGI